MALLFSFWPFCVLIILVGLLTISVFYFKYVYLYWKRRGVPFLEPSFPFGNIGSMIFSRKQVGLVYRDMYNQLQGHKLGGIFHLHRPTLLLRDMDTIKHFLVKDFANFHDRGTYVDEKNDPLSLHLFNMAGHKWKNLRAKLTPTLTSGKMRMMFRTLLECSEGLIDCLRDDAEAGNSVEMKDLVSRYSIDVIASCAFGIKCNCIQNPDSEFFQKGRAFFSQGTLRAIGFFLNMMVPSLGRIVNLGNTPKDISEFFLKLVRDTVDYREKNDVIRNDLMHLMIQLKNKGYVEEDGNKENGDEITIEAQKDSLTKLTVDELAAQAFVFFLAGFETSSTTVSFCLYEMAINSVIQSRMRSEIDTVLARHGGQLTYEAMKDMEYMDMVVAETLRKYPPVPVLSRECTTAYTLPDGVVVEPGTPVVVPVYGLHHDPQYYPDPEKFDPQRFTPEMKSSRKLECYLPFGEGPRVCIGKRFGYMQTKVALISLLSKYQFQISQKTQIPALFDENSFTLSTKGGIYLTITARS